MDEAHASAGATAVYSGTLFRGDELDETAQKRQETEVGGPIAAAFRERRIGAAYGALACGADILFAEAALAAGAELHVALPFDAEEFFQTSVVMGNPPDAPARWDERYRRCLKQAAGVTLLVADLPPEEWRDSAYFHAFRLAAGMALIEADRRGSGAVMLTFDDGRSVTNIAGTPRAVQEWQAVGGAVVGIPIGLPPRRSVTRAAPHDGFRTVIIEGGGGHVDAGVTTETGDVASAVEMLRAVAARARGAAVDFLPTGPRFGQASDGVLAVHAREAIASGTILATPQFAAEARLAKPAGVSFGPMPSTVADRRQPYVTNTAYRLSFQPEASGGGAGNL